MGAGEFAGVCVCAVSPFAAWWVSKQRHFMSTVVEKLKSELAELTVRERAHVADFLLQSLDGEPDVDVEAAWDAELERRAEMIRAGEAKGEPAEKVFAELRQRFS